MGEWTDRPTTVEQALDNLTEENWHTERRLIEEAIKQARADERRVIAEALREDAASLPPNVVRRMLEQAADAIEAGLHHQAAHDTAHGGPDAA